MNPSIFLGSRIGEDPPGFLDEIFKIVDAMGVSFREKAELASYQLKEVAQIWYTQWKANRLEKAGPIEWEEFKESFLGKYFPLEKRECKIEDVINLRQGNMSVEDYALKFSMLSRYSPSLVSNLREEMSRFVTDVFDLVKEECRTTMLHGNMNISRLVVCAQSIEESKMTRMRKDLKRGGGGSQFAKPTCSTCGKKHFGKCLASTSGCYGCGKNDHKVRDCPTLTARRREAKQASHGGPNLDDQKKTRFYALQANKEANPNGGAGKL
ncbi:uncharacterized protein LOC125824280 [Solanum verrucosum]|uniref:uncharacterized protein LOC125824280 n=1 Tax=Solanum verrucosum TaxID=315347 RepID=UPI0020D09833|nr:uncharacterized protein LOC125824280 [Solanum verrucosum]